MRVYISRIISDQVEFVGVRGLAHGLESVRECERECASVRERECVCERKSERVCVRESESERVLSDEVEFVGVGCLAHRLL